MNNKISTHLWFDKEAKDAAALYTSLFPNSCIKQTTVLEGTPSGTVDLLVIDLAGQEFTLISAGPYFKFTNGVSFLVVCETKEEVDALWKKLSEGGVAQMELGSYPFSERYGWLRDRFGLSWQLMYQNGQPVTQKIVPTLMFTGAIAGKAEEAMNFYVTVFKQGAIDHIMRYHEGEGPEIAGTVRHAGFKLEGMQFAAMDSHRAHPDAKFNEAVSFIVNCETQTEINAYWDQLTADPSAEQCGWLKDKFGLSWQIVPIIMNEMMKQGTPEQMDRVTKAFLQMKKFDIEALKRAYEGT